MNIERILNNTYSSDCIGTTMDELQLTNYNYLYDIQKHLVGNTTFDFTFNDLKKDNRIQYDLLKNRYVLKIDKEFITHSRVNAFLRSKFTNKLLDIFEITNNHIFYFTCLCFVDGELFTGYKIYPTTESTYLVFEHEYVLNTDKNSKLSVIILPNLNIVSEKTNKYRLSKGIPSDTREQVQKSNGKQKFQYIHSISLDNSNGILMLTKKQGNAIHYSTPIPKDYDEKWFNLNRIGFQHLNGTKLLKKYDVYFDIPQKNMPVVAETMIVFERTSTGLSYAHGVRVKSFYPNVYCLENRDINKNYYILHFYYDDTLDMGVDTMIYNNDFSLLDRIGFNLLDYYEYDLLEPVVADYKPQVINYSIKDYQNSNIPNFNDYKDNYLKKLIEKDATNVIPYLSNQMTYPYRLYLDISRVDLDTRIRDTTMKETPHSIINFRKPHYVFSLKKNILANPYKMRIYIDGAIQVYHTMTENEHNIYLYIPCEFVTPFSMMEFESFKDEYIHQHFTIKDNVAILDITTELNICSDDIFILEPDGKVVDSTEYSLHIETPLGYIPLSDEYNTRLKSNVKIKFNKPSRKNYVFIVMHPSITIKQEILTEDDRGKAIYVDNVIDRDIEHLRIYKNGRLVPREHYDIKYRENIQSQLGIDILLDKNIGDVVVVDISPLKYNEVLKIKNIPITGLIKTNGILDKPFSLKWYDVYLNGKKLNASNIDIISASKFFIYNVESRKNLVIMESNRDLEYFNTLENWRSYNDDLWDEYPGLSDQLILQNGFIFETETSVITSSVSPTSINMDRFYEYYAKNQPILNPDEAFIPNEIWGQFDDLKTDNVILLDPDINPNAPSLLEFINVDEGF